MFTFFSIIFQSLPLTCGCPSSSLHAENKHANYENQLTKDHSENIPNSKETTLTAEYSSDKVKLVSKKELKEIIIKQNLIPKSS